MTNDVSIATNKSSMQITDRQLVSWGTVKGTILNYIKRYLNYALPNTISILTNLENEYTLSEQTHHEVFPYRNSVSGFINKITGKAQDWPSSSIFSYIKGNKVILITLAGIIEYDKSDVKQTPSGEAYINNAKAHFFNGADVNVSICATNDDGLTSQQLENGDFNGDDIRLFPAIPENINIQNIDDIKELTTYEIFFNSVNGSHKYHLLNNSNDGINISNLDDDNIFTGSLSYTLNNKDIEICQGNFANFMPYGNVKVKYYEVDGKPSSQFLQADGCGGVCNENLSVVNIPYIVNDFINKISDSDKLNDNGISEISNQFRSSLTNILQANTCERENDNETGDRFNTIFTNAIRREDQCFYKIRTLFNGKYVDQIIQYDNNGNYLIAETNLNSNASGSMYEVQLGNGNLFIGKITVNETTGDVYFMEGKFLNREGKVIDSKKQISLQEALSLPFIGARDINENDLKEFKDSNRIIVEKGENGYDFTAIGQSFDNTIKNNKVFSKYLPPLNYINKQIDNVELFLKLQLEAFNNSPEKNYDKYIQQIDKNGFSNQLIEDIRQVTKKFYEQSEKKTYILSNGEKLTKESLSAFYAQLSQLQYLYNMRCRRQELDGNNVKNNKPTNETIACNNDHQKKTTNTPHDEEENTAISNDGKDNRGNKEENGLTGDKTTPTNDNLLKSLLDNNNKKNTAISNDGKDNRGNKEENGLIGGKIMPANDNLLKQQLQNNDNINKKRYPKILSTDDLIAILTDPESNKLAGKSQENQAIFSNIMANVIDNDNNKIDLFIKTCQLLHESRGNICKNGVKILPLSQAEYENLMKLNRILTYSMDNARNPDLYKQVQSYHLEITDEYNGKKDDFNKAMKFALDGKERLNMTLHAKNCKLFDELDKTGDIKRCCNDVLYERDINGEDINKKYSEHYNAYKNQDSLNEASSFNLEAAPYNAVDGII